MELAIILIVPMLASALSLLPLGRRFAAPITLAASAVVLALAIAVAMQAAKTGRVDAWDEWLTCDGLARISHTIFASSGTFARRFVCFFWAQKPVASRDARDAGTFAGFGGAKKLGGLGGLRAMPRG